MEGEGGAQIPSFSSDAVTGLIGRDGSRGRGKKPLKKGKWQLRKRRHFLSTRVHKMKPYKMSPFPRFCSKLVGRYFAPPVTQGKKKKETQGGEGSNVCCLHSLFDVRRNSKIRIMFQSSVSRILRYSPSIQTRMRDR